MQLISVRIRVLALMLMAIASLGGAVTACSTTPQDSAQNPAATEANNEHSQMSGGMDHSSDHSMSMDLGPADENYDLRFIDGMTLHHQGAIAMAKEAEQKSQRAEIKTLAGDIIKAQSREEKELLQQWRKAWYPDADAQPMAYSPQMGHMMEMSAEQKQSMMMTESLGEADEEFDLRFLDAMIVHHEGALVMAQDALAKSKRPEVKQLAEDIISSQQKEIDQMKQWRQTWYK